MTIAHKDLTEANLHETKGVSTASANTVHVRASAGVSGWAKINKNNIDTSSIKNTNIFTLNVRMADVSTPGSVYVVSPYDGTVRAIYSVIDGGITSSNTTVTAKLSGVAMTNGTMTITASGSAAGDVDSCNPTALNVVNAGQAIVLESDGASSTTASSVFTIVIEMS